MLNSPTRNPKILTVLAGAGFTFETRCLLRSMRDAADFSYLCTWFGGTPGSGDIPPGPSYPVLSFASVTQPSTWQSLKAAFGTFFTTLRVLHQNDFDCVLAVGCSHAVPMFVAAKLFARKTIYLESITRADQLSNTGKVVYWFRLANTFLIQWPDLQKHYQRSRLGTIL